ncbi:MAG TPA: hypothetical protein VFR23_20020, partial [Jiangellaceae bacterium]|nr:hypothetical protein [Jiangellaceae bacterium]
MTYPTPEAEYPPTGPPQPGSPQPHPSPVPPPRMCGAKHGMYGKPSLACLMGLDHDGDHVDEEGGYWHNYGPLQHYEIA